MNEDVAEQAEKKSQESPPADLLPDRDPEETQEWMESLDEVLAREGPERTQFLLRQLLGRKCRSKVCVSLPHQSNRMIANHIRQAIV